MQIDKVVQYILTQNKPYIYIYIYPAFDKRGINTKKIIWRLKEVYGEYWSGCEFLEFGDTYLNEYLIEKHGLDFNEFLMGALKPVYSRFKHLS